MIQYTSEYSVLDGIFRFIPGSAYAALIGLQSSLALYFLLFFGQFWSAAQGILQANIEVNDFQTINNGDQWKMNMGVSIPGLPEQSVEDIMNKTPDDKKKDRI